MKHLLLLLTLFIGASSMAQGMGDVTIYSNTGDQFYVVLNGVRQNVKPETNVKVTGLTEPWYSCKIISANNNFTIEKNLPVKYDTLMTYRIIEKKGKFKLRFFSSSALGTNTVVKDQSIVTYHATENIDPITATATTGDPQTKGSNTTSGMSTTTTTTTTSTSTGNENIGTSSKVNTGDGESIQMNVTITETGMGANVDMNVSGTGDEKLNSTSTSDVKTVSTTTTSNTTSGTGGTLREESTTTSTSSGGNGTTSYKETTTTTTTSGNTTDQGNLYKDDDVSFTVENNCSTTDEEVNALVKQVKAEAFADDQQRVANLAAQNKCMSTTQIRKVAEAFTFSENQLSFMKKAYDNCTDQSNYYTLMDVLTFSDDKEALQTYINSK